MTDAELIDLAAKVRTAQKAYFKSRSKDDLIKSKQLESLLDKEIAVREAVAGNSP